MRQNSLSPWKPSIFAVIALLVPQVMWAASINIGSIGVDPGDEIKKFSPLADYLAKQLQSEGIDQGRIVVAKGIPQMATYVREGKVDLYIDSPFPAVAVSRLAGSKFLLRRWKKGIPEYHSVIFTRKDTRIDRVEGLRGKIIAFEEPFSSSGYFLPKLVLAQRGLKLVQKSQPADLVAPEEIGYAFSYDDETTMVWVLRGKAAAGAMDNQNYRKEAKGKLDELKVIHETFPLPRQIVTYRPGLSPTLVARIKHVLLTMDQSEEGRKALQAFERTTKFDELPDEAMSPLLKSVKFIDAEFGLE